MTVTVRTNIPDHVTEGELNSFTQDPAKTAGLTARDPDKIIAALKQIIETRETGSLADRTVLFRDLVAMGLVGLNYNGQILKGTVGGSNGGIIGDPPGTGVVPITPPDTPNYNTPPAPTGLECSAVMKTVFVSWDYPPYDYHGYTEVWRADSDNLGLAVLVGTSLSTIYIDPDVGTNVTRYYWIRFVSKWNVTGPYNDTAGTMVQTGLDVDYLLEVLTGQITESQLYADLGARIDQIDTLQMEVASITAGTAGSFDPWKTYYFDTDAEGWVSDNNATVGHSGSWLTVDGTGANPAIKLSADLAGFKGSNYPYVNLRIKRVAGTGWSGILRWKTAGHDFVGANQQTLADPALAVGAVTVISFDMSAITDWNDSTILNLRIELGADAADDFDIDWIAIGRPAPGASIAQLGDETTARVTADNVEVQKRELLSAKVLGVTDPTGLTLPNLTQGIVYEEREARATAVGAVASDVSILQTTVGNHTTSIQQQAISIDGIKAQYTIKIDNNNYVTGFGLASEPVNGQPYSTFAVRADSFWIASPEGPGVQPNVPFIVKTTPWVEGGQTNPAGVYMNKAMIGKGYISNAEIADATILDGKIVSLKAGKLTTDVVGGDLISESYTSGVAGAGWRINRNGWAEFNNAIVRGTIYAGAGQFGGSLTAATGTFRGSLTAATGTFAGSLSAATGTFAGNLTAASGTLGTIDVVGDGGGYHFIRSINKSWKDSQNGWILARKGDDGATFLEFKGYTSWIRMSSWGDNEINFNEQFKVDSGGNVWAYNIYARGDIQASSIKVGSANIIDTLMINGNAVTLSATADAADPNLAALSIYVPAEATGQKIVVWAWVGDTSTGPNPGYGNFSVTYNTPASSNNLLAQNAIGAVITYAASGDYGNNQYHIQSSTIIGAVTAWWTGWYTFYVNWANTSMAGSYYPNSRIVATLGKR